MSESTTKLLEDRIVAILERVRVLAAERNALEMEVATLRKTLGDRERSHAAAKDKDVQRLERENARLRRALEGAIRELREEAGT
jgi:regulator of replication initiation timing